MKTITTKRAMTIAMRVRQIPLLLPYVGLLVSLVAIASLATGAGAAQGGRYRSLGQSEQSTEPPSPILGGFTYQGRLKDGANPANGLYDFTFALYDTQVGGLQVGNTITMTNQTVADGLFTVRLSFGGDAFEGEARWLQSAVRPAGVGSYTALVPRQTLTATPYAESLVPGATISGTSGGRILSVYNAGGSGILGQAGAPLTSGVMGVATSNGGRGVYGQATGSGGTGVWGESVVTDGKGLVGIANTGANARGVEGTSTSGNGVYAASTNGTAMYAVSTNGIGVYGLSNATSGQGVYGEANNGGAAVGVYGRSNSGASGFGVYGLSTATDGKGVGGVSNNGPNAVGVYGISSSGRGVYGQTFAADSEGIYGVSSNGSSASGVQGYSASGRGVYGLSDGGRGVVGRSTATDSEGVYGEANSGTAASGVQGSSSSARGVYGSSTATNGEGIYGVANSGSSARGVYGTSSAGTGVYGNSGDGHGVYGTSNTGSGVYGITAATNGQAIYGRATGTSSRGVFGEANNGGSAIGVQGSSTNGTGVYGSSTNGIGVSGFSSNDTAVIGYSVDEDGVYGTSTNDDGVVGFSTNGLAGRFLGDVVVTGGCCAAGSGSTTIDHPLDPANKYLTQALVESPNMMNIYNGNVTTDAKGEAVVTLPDYVDALNRDFRYQLTVVGQFAQAIVSSKVQGNRFTIKTDKPNVEVSWQVVGIRKDPYAEAHPIEVETDKPVDEQGKYRHPTEHGQPESKGVDYEQRQRVKPEEEKK